MEQYITNFEKDDGDKLDFPLPEPSDINQSSLVDFDAIKGDLKKVTDEVKSKFYTSLIQS